MIVHFRGNGHWTVPLNASVVVADGPAAAEYAAQNLGRLIEEDSNFPGD